MFCARYIPRLLHIGLLAFAVALLAVMLVQRSARLFAREPVAQAASDVTVVDVARGVTPGMLPSLVKIGHDERVVAVDDMPVASDIEAGAAIAYKGLGASTYLDLTVGGARGQRRVLVLLH